MNILKAFFKAIPRLFKAIFSPTVLRKLDLALTQIEDILPEALEAVSFVAAMTPTRADDEIIRLARDYAYGPFSGAMLLNKEETLRGIARLVLQKKIRVSAKDSILNAALEIAYTTHKATQE